MADTACGAQVVKLPQNLALHSQYAASEWKFWKSSFDDYLIVTGQHTSEDKIKLALLRNMMGQEASRIVASLPIKDRDAHKYDKIIEAIEAFVNPRTNTVFERFKFSQRRQADGEPFDKYLTECRELIKSCSYDAKIQDEILRDHIIFTIADKNVQEALLRLDDLDLEKTVKFCRAREQASNQVNQMNTNVEPIEVMLARSNRSNMETMQKFKCRRCQLVHGPRQCPAFGKPCKKCGIKNHFAVSCQVRRNVREVTVAAEDDSEALYCGIVDNVSELKCDQWFEIIDIEGFNIKCKLDTGADISVMPLSIFKMINDKVNLQLVKSNIRVESFEGKSVYPLGMVNLLCKFKNLESFQNFIVVDCNSMLLGLPACISLMLVKRVCSMVKDDGRAKFIKLNNDLFTGIGQVPGTFDIPTRQILEQISYPSQRIPHSLYEPLKSELQRLIDRKAIIKVDSINENACINRVALVERANRNLRLCLDPADLNKYIVKKPKVLPTLDELAFKLTGKKFFSVLDLSEGFHHLRLTDKASWKCCFATPFGVYRYLVLPYGLSNAPELFQETLENYFGRIKNVIVWADDILVMGETPEIHDQTMCKVLDMARSLGVVFNQNKLQYRQKEVKYVGQIFNEWGMSIDKSRVESLIKLPPPSNREELMRIIGSFNYVRRYVPDMSECMSTLCKLLKKDVEFSWLPIHTKAFNDLKTKVSCAPALVPFDTKKQIVLQCDASKNGLGCCLFQKYENDTLKLVSCVSRTMNNAELNYGQTEKELLAICFGVSKFYKFIYGQKVDIQTDHKPIVAIMSKAINKVGSPRLRRMRLKLLPYHLNVYYVPGKYVHFADMLSRSSLKVTEHDDEMLEMVHSVSKYLPISSKRKVLIRNHTSNDTILSKLIEYYYHGWPDKLSEDCKVYEKFKNDIYFQEGLLFIDNNIVIPTSLRQNCLSLIHKSHQGVSKCYTLAKQLFFWPGMKNDIVTFVSKCRVCEKYSPNNCKENLLPHKIPVERYIKVGCDVLEFCGNSYLVIVDYFSHWLELIRLSSKNSTAIIDAMQSVFCRLGFPVELIADNMPFSSYECKLYFKSKDITLITSTPRYPRSNGMAEKGVHICKQILKKYNDENKDFREGIMHYNNTPLSGFKVSPSQILNSRRLRTELPCTLDLLKPKIENVYKELCKKQDIVKKCYDKRARLKCTNYKPGDNVVYRNGNIWEKAKIVSKCPEPRSYIIAKDNDQQLRRNTSQLKKSFTGPAPIRKIIEFEDAGQTTVTNVHDHVLRTRSGRVVNKRSLLDL